MSNEQIQLSPEGAAIAQAVAKSMGVSGNSVAPNVRMRESRNGVALTSMAHPVNAGPILAIDVDDILRPTQLDDLIGVILGMRIVHRDGIASEWVLVVRRSAERLCELVYDSEEQCELERDMLRMEIDAWLTGGVPFEMPTKATSIINFNPANGQEL